MAEIEKVLEAEPNYPPALCTKGELLEKLGRDDEALEYFNRVQDLIKGNETWELLYKYVVNKLEKR